jgi:RNase adapter protein RapZ
MHKEHQFELTVLTGMSGAGRTTAARALEDLGWFVIDNLPPKLMAGAIELARTSADVRRMAVVVDTRSRSFFAQLSESLAEVSTGDTQINIIFLEASDESLVRRFESSRRPHPLQREQRIIDGLARERELLQDIRGVADLVIDTTALNVHDLRRRIESVFSLDSDAEIHVTVLSFGFKYGIPVDADTVADVRFLPNPYWDEHLRPLTGQDQAVAVSVLERPGATDFLTSFESLIAIAQEGYLREGKRLVTVAIGCTGGKHRSVAMSEALAERLRARGIDAVVFHRDLGRE